MAGAVVQPARYERPTRHTGGCLHQSRPVIVPSMVEGMGRTTTICFSEDDGSVLVGVDVATPQRWLEVDKTWVSYAAGGGTDGSIIDYPYKKVSGLQESTDYAIWLAGSNGNGGIFRRSNGDAQWDLVSTELYGESNDGGSSNPRRTKASTMLIEGTTCFAACRRETGSPNWGVARSADSGATWSNTWLFGTGRNYTSLASSPQWNAIYATADNREGSGNDGVFILTGLASGTGTATRIDNQGSGAPTLSDVRHVWVGRIGTTEYVYVVQGNLSGSDPDSGLWLCRVSSDPTGGGFNPSTHCVWTRALTTGAADRLNAVVGWQSAPGSGPIFLMVGYFRSSTNASGTYTLTPGAGGLVRNYRVFAQRTFDGEDTTGPTWETVSNDFNVSMVTYGTDHDHVMSYVGEGSNEQSRFGGQSFAIQDMAISSDGQRVVTAGKSSPWVCDNPWGGVPIWQPFSKGLGALEGGYASVFVAGTNRVAIGDDDRGLYTFVDFGYIRPEWVIAENIDGVPSTNNAMNGVSLATDGDSLVSPRRGDGRSYRTTDPWDYDEAFITAIYTSARTAPAIGAFQWVDSLANTRYLEITAAAVHRDNVQVATIASDATRVEFLYSGATCWLHYPDLGIYRSTDNGATWVLWWNYAIADEQYAQFCGHIAQDADDPNVLYAAFDAGGVWQCVDANTSTAGSGLGGSRPTGTALLTGGSLPAGTEPISAITVDRYRGDIWACGFDPDGSAPPTLHVNPAGQSLWFEWEDSEYAEACIIPQYINAYDGYLWISTASVCTLRRLA